MVPIGNRFLSIGAAAGSLALLAAVVLMLWPPEPAEYQLTAGREQADGETVGWVSKVESNTIHVNSGPFGGGVVPLVVTKGTRITVGAKEGWFEDIRPGGQVKVAYELYHGRRFARSVELLVDEGAKRPARGPMPVKGTAEAPAQPEKATSAPDPRPAPKVAAPVPVAPIAPPAPVVVAPAPAPKPAPVVAKPAPAPEVRPAPRPEPAPVVAKPAPAPEVRPAPRPEPPPVAAKPAEVVPPPQRTSTSPARNASGPENGARPPEPARAVEAVRPPTPAAPRPAEPARAAEGGDTTDGSAAVDWLLKRR